MVILKNCPLCYFHLFGKINIAPLIVQPRDGCMEWQFIRNIDYIFHQIIFLSSITRNKKVPGGTRRTRTPGVTTPGPGSLGTRGHEGRQDTIISV